MRVLVDGSSIGAEPSGARTRLIHLLRAYATLADRHDLVVLCTDASGVAHELGAGVESVAVPPPPSAARRLATGRSLWRERLRRVPADVIQAETLPLPPALGPRLLLTLHDLRALDVATGGGARAFYARRLLPAALGRVDRVIAVSEHTAAEVTSRLGMDGTRVRVVPNAPDPRVVPPAASAIDAFRVRFRLEGRFVLALGHLERRKNLGVLIEAMRALGARDRGRRASLVIAGQDRGEAKRLRAVAGLEPVVDVTFTGPLDDDERAAALHEASALAIPSLVEGFGIVPLEAMLLGCPVVAANRGALPEIVGDAAFVVPPDADAFAKALERVLDDPAAAERLRSLGRQRARAFTWEAAARKLRDVHDEVGQELRRR